MNRRSFLKFTGICISALLPVGNAAIVKPGKSGKRPNIVLIFTDDHARKAIGCYGSTHFKTPNLDHMASQGMRFDNAFVTNSLCAPSRAVLLTGKYSHINGLKTNIQPNSADQKGYSVLPFYGYQQTFPKLLQENGYKTAWIGKWHLEGNPQGFDWWEILLGQGDYNDPTMKLFDFSRKHKGYTTDVITDLCIKKLDEFSKSGQPFMLVCSHKSPHGPWDYPPRCKDLYKDKVFEHPENWQDWKNGYKGKSDAAEHAYIRTSRIMKQFHDKSMTEEEKMAISFQEYLRKYGRCTAALDENIGKLLDHLDQSGLSKNTLVMYTTDNGMFLGEHGWIDKRFIYEEALTVPLLIQYPKSVKAGSVSKQMVLNLDLAETILDYAGVEIPKDMQGRSLRPLLEEQNVKDWRESVYYRFYEYPGPNKVYPHYGVRTDRYKLIFFNTLDQWELYDLKSDPHEMNNIYDNPEHVSVVKGLKNELQRLRAKYGDYES